MLSPRDRERASALFHKLWGAGKDGEPYEKKVWCELHVLLMRAGAVTDPMQPTGPSGTTSTDPVRPACPGPVLSGSGGHRVHDGCGAPVDWWYPDDDVGGYCDAHLPPGDREHRHYLPWTGRWSEIALQTWRELVDENERLRRVIDLENIRNRETLR